MVRDDSSPPGIRLTHKTCPGKPGGYTWTYKGEGKVYACCPQCRTPIKIDKSLAEETDGSAGPGTETPTG